MKYHDLKDLTRETVLEAFADLATGGKRPYGMSIAEANAAMMEGFAEAAADVILAASRSPDSHGFVVDHCNRIIIARVACWDVEGQA